MKIRVANRYDIESIITMMDNYSEHSPVHELRHNKNEAHVRSLIISIIMGHGVIWIAEHDNEYCGMLIVIEQGSLWNPQVKLLSELAYWIEPQHRGSTAAYRLLKAYEKYGDELVAQHKISGYTISRLHTSNFKPEKLGYTMIEQTYVKQPNEENSVCQ